VVSHAVIDVVIRAVIEVVIESMSFVIEVVIEVITVICDPVMFGREVVIVPAACRLFRW